MNVKDANSMIRLLTRGDDAGSSRSANRAMRDAFEQGILRNVSVLAVGPEVEDAASQLAGVDGLCCGLHAAVTCEWEWPRWGSIAPAAQVADLRVEDGGLPRLPILLHDRKVAASTIILEIESQLARLRKLGFDVKYMDTHMGFQWLPAVDEALRALADRESLIYQPPIEKLVIKVSDEASCRAAALIAALSAAAPGDYLVVSHPTYDDAEMGRFFGAGSSAGQVGSDRNDQRLMFMHPDVVTYCERHGVALIRYDELAGVRSPATEA